MDTVDLLVKAIGAVWTVLTIVGAAYMRDKQSELKECRNNLAARDKADADALAAYRRRDEELIRSRAAAPPSGSGL